MIFTEELKHRGMLHNIMPGTEDLLKNEKCVAYVGIDPTADSLHIGHLVSVMMLKHFQKAGHKPIVLIGGATGMIGDPSGKSKERNLLDLKTLLYNQNKIKKQLSKHLDFSQKNKNNAELCNNYDWMKEISFLDFIRDIGKHITVNYMTAKDSVKKRMTGEGDKEAEGLSFTEFSYQLVQAYDFFYLYSNKNCKLQMGGSDQWGNITTGTELIKRKIGGKAYALTCPLITKADGGKFGKTEKGNIWLDKDKTSPYEFYQFWMNTSDKDAEKYIKIFTILPIEKINTLIEKHREQSYLRLLQKTLAKELTITVHSEKDYNSSVEASQILFGKSTKKTIEMIDSKIIDSVFATVPDYYYIPKDILKNGINIIELLAVKTNIFKSKAEAKRNVKGNGISINQEKFKNLNGKLDDNFLIKEKYILVKRGKKKYYIIEIC